MKKLILFFLFLFTITELSAVDKDLEIKVKNLFEKKMEAAKNRNNTQISDSFNINKIGTDMYSDPKLYEILSKIYKQMEYSVKSVKIKGNTAEIHLDFKIPDAGRQVAYSIVNLTDKSKTLKYKSLSGKDLEKAYYMDIYSDILNKLNNKTIMYENKKNMKVIIDKAGNWDNVNFDFDTVYGKQFVTSYLGGFYIFKERLGK
ncbi:hypothetical protein [Pseudoleptotrichia goodfellowii]|uniref:Uncharacterized protein n=1 Tax=Pseudoleptotrichia goodfellowii F0264 TaxID=596323 RepID=D0GPL8_9FUSO|nr:hypothetical protein [Pseudoleptotrichia goodfellowii]EEY33963.1 hypothetical protein HMPREF0554_0052 [Pseudoleptotrichia goodfellowii F0264]